jgi:cullin 3
VIANYLDTVAEESIVPAFVVAGSTTGSTLGGQTTVVDGAGADAGASFLKKVKVVWDDYTTAMTMIHYALFYLVG